MSSVINRRCSYIFLIILVFCSVLYLSGCRRNGDEPPVESSSKTAAEEETTNMEETTGLSPATSEAEELTTGQAEDFATGKAEDLTTGEAKEMVPEDRSISWDPGWEYADYSKIHESDVKLYYSHSPSRKEMVVAVNAGHGTSGGESEKTLNHPDGSGKVTGGTNSQGAKYSMAISSGMEFNDGTPEAAANLSAALMLKDALLEEGFDVLMIREEKDTRLDNIARTVFANNNADCHISLHYDSTESDKGVFYISVPDVASYRNMEPVASHWKEHNALGENLIRGMKRAGVEIFKSGSIELDLTQTSYSTIPSVDLELGDAASDHSEKTQRKLVEGIVAGLSSYAGQ